MILIAFLFAFFISNKYYIKKPEKNGYRISTEKNEEKNIAELEQRQGQRMGASHPPARPGD